MRRQYTLLSTMPGIQALRMSSLLGRPGNRRPWIRMPRTSERRQGHGQLHPKAARPRRTYGSCEAQLLEGPHSAGDVIGDRYIVHVLLGQGCTGLTYKCLDKATGEEVAVKAMALRGMKSWKQLELFKREAQALKSLSHPGIPKYLDYFEADSEHDRRYYLVQELGAGPSLADMVARGWHANEAEVERIAGEMLSVLNYLGSLRPPITHRDVKPHNILIEGGCPGGRVLLVDFGSVQVHAALGDRFGSTMAGTYGFMPLEQSHGHAEPKSDLYGLGATLLFLLSGRHPSEFPLSGLHIDCAGVPMSFRLRRLLAGLLEPDVAERLTACQALNLLQSSRPMVSWNGTLHQLPAKGHVGLLGCTYMLQTSSSMQLTKQVPILKLPLCIPSARSPFNVPALEPELAVKLASFILWQALWVATRRVFFFLLPLPFFIYCCAMMLQAEEPERDTAHQAREAALEIGAVFWAYSEEGDNVCSERGGRTADLAGAWAATGFIVLAERLVMPPSTDGYVFVKIGPEKYRLHYLGPPGALEEDKAWRLARTINSHLLEIGVLRPELLYALQAANHRLPPEWLQ